MKKASVLLVVLFVSTLLPFAAVCQEHSVARRWNEVLLEAIRNDYARPTVHARNLFHTSIALYDSWAVFDPLANPYMLGKVVHNYSCPFNGIAKPSNVKQAQEETMSFAAYRLLSHRFANSPGATGSQFMFDTLMTNLGYDVNTVSTDYSTGSYAALGNYLAENIIAFGLVDGANESAAYDNSFYTPVNPTLVPVVAGNPNIVDYNRWQPLTLQVFIDQSGHIHPLNTPDFLGPEWGTVLPFALTEEDLTINTRDGNDYWVYHDPGMPPMMDTANVTGSVKDFTWSFELVARWSAHLSGADTTTWDISPASIGNIQNYPTTFTEHQNFYNLEQGGDIGVGHDLNPVTNQPYAPQKVKRGDYARVLAEFWADGPASETPPGHWFTILNYINDHQLLVKKYMGTGPVLSNLEWDVKAYFTLGGAIHDAAVAAWGVKGWYDFIRPISVIRYMADLGQSSNPSDLHYHQAGLTLVDDVVEIVRSGDLLAGSADKNVGKIKLNVWRGPDYITDQETDTAGVGWILAENWWPYQRPTFITPPFAGFVSGHSTFSRAAAEVLTAFTGDAFFPGGMGEFHAKKNEFLVFEDGPSTDVTLQWATYRDASDQCSLSRIWGGIHPTIDDIPGRLMGIEIGNDAFAMAKDYFEGKYVSINSIEADPQVLQVFPNPVLNGSLSVRVPERSGVVKMSIVDVSGKIFHQQVVKPNQRTSIMTLDVSNLVAGMYLVRVQTESESFVQKLSVNR
ncbi:T9SS type A sorting domain-containing protein [Bacteroidota bacterium]